MKRWLMLVVALMAIGLSASALVLPETVYSLTRVSMCDTVVAIGGDERAQSLTVEIRAAVVNDRERVGESTTTWGVRWSDGLAVMLRSGNSAFGGAMDERYARVTVMWGDSLMADCKFTKGFAMVSRRANTLIVNRTLDGGVTVRGGDGVPLEIASLSLPGDDTMPMPSFVCQGRVDVVGAMVEWLPDRSAPLMTEWTVERLRERFEVSTDPVEGFWQYFDRRNDPDYARLGGRYVIAAVKEDGGGYTLLYISGAEVNGPQWQKCMRKGGLTPTVFVGQYDMSWVDATMELMTKDLNARIEQDALLVLEFPMYKSRLRFSKMPSVLWDRL